MSKKKKKKKKDSNKYIDFFPRPTPLSSMTGSRKIFWEWYFIENGSENVSLHYLLRKVSIKCYGKSVKAIATPIVSIKHAANLCKPNSIR